MEKIKQLDLSNHQALSNLHRRTYSTKNEVLDVIWADKDGKLIWHQEVNTNTSDYGHVSYNSNQIKQAKTDLQQNHTDTSHIIESHTHPDMSSSLSQQDISTITNNKDQHSHLLRIEAEVWGRQGIIYRLFEPDHGHIKANKIRYGNHIADSKNTFLFVDGDNDVKIVRKEQISSHLSEDTERQVA